MTNSIAHPIDFKKSSSKITVKDNLADFDLDSCPFSTFLNWYKKSMASELNIDAMSVATVDANGTPRNRFLLFKGIVDSKFIFYTNYLSQKARNLDQNPKVSLNFFWASTKYQVRVTGEAKKSSREFSEKYFSSRDRESQLASAMSQQSSPVDSRDDLVKKVQDLNKQFPEIIPCPDHWGGYMLEPFEFEFFIYGAHRLNDRFLFVKNKTEWTLSRLQP